MSLGSPVTLSWLGHSSFSLRLAGGEVVLIDPWLTGNPACPAPCATPARVDAIVLTHGHSDHLGDTLALAMAHRAKVVTNFEIGVWLQRKGVDPAQIVGMNKGGTVEVIDGLHATMVHADHSSAIAEDDGSLIYGGEPAGYVLAASNMPVTYVAGDTALFSDMTLIGETLRPEVAVLPIGGFYTMAPQDAARAAEMLGVRRVVPCHYGTFPILSGTPERLAQELAHGIDVVAVKPGEELP